MIVKSMLATIGTFVIDGPTGRVLLYIGGRSFLDTHAQHAKQSSIYLFMSEDKPGHHNLSLMNHKVLEIPRL